MMSMITLTRCSSIPSAETLVKPNRFDEPNSALERLIAAPAVDDHALTCLHLDGVGGQEIDCDLEVARVADLDHGRAGFDDALALLQQLQHLAVDRRAQRDARALCASRCRSAGETSCARARSS